jgi:VanZ family protein
VLALAGRWARVPWVALAAGLAAYAATTEVLQSLLPVNRHGDVRDWLADLAGVAIGAAVSLLLARAARRGAPSPSRPPA